MRFDYRTNTLTDDSPGTDNLARRFRRAGLLAKAGRWSDQQAVEFILRDFPYVERIYRAVDLGPRTDLGFMPRTYDV